jgi:hypothetical protein
VMAIDMGCTLIGQVKNFRFSFSDGACNLHFFKTDMYRNTLRRSKIAPFSRVKSVCQNRMNAHAH